MHLGMHGGMHGGGHHGMRFHGDRHGGMKHGGGRHMARMLDNFDSNGDGKLSQEEIDQKRGARPRSLDGDTDQSHTLGESNSEKGHGEEEWVSTFKSRRAQNYKKKKK